MDNTFHLGKMIKEYIDLKNFKRTVVADMVGVQSTGIYVFEKQATMETGTLMRFCHGLKYNFFMDVANSLPKEYDHGKLVASEREELIVRMEEEIKNLKH